MTNLKRLARFVRPHGTRMAGAIVAMASRSVKVRATGATSSWFGRVSRTATFAKLCRLAGPRTDFEQFISLIEVSVTALASISSNSASLMPIAFAT